jgi:hypothetical protein
MSHRLQVLLDDSEFEDLRRAAHDEGVAVAELVRRALREARGLRPEGDLGAKLNVVRAATAYEFPTADIDQMLAETERGYGSASE